MSSEEVASILSFTHTHTHADMHTGVYLSLRGTVYVNNSVIPIAEIGETNTTSNTGLQCVTDRIRCCASPEGRAGEWYFPDGTLVPIKGLAKTFYRNRGDDGTVNLNRLSGIMIPTGKLCCEVPDLIGITDRVCANIGTKSRMAVHVQ